MPRESAVKTVLIGVAITITASFLIAAYQAKEDVSAHAADIARIDANIQRLLDLTCEKPENIVKRQCGTAK